MLKGKVGQKVILKPVRCALLDTTWENIDEGFCDYLSGKDLDVYDVDSSTETYLRIDYSPYEHTWIPDDIIDYNRIIN